MSEFSAAWCLSMVGTQQITNGVPFHSTFVFENGIHGDEKELKKENLHSSLVFLSISVAEMYFSDSW